MKTLFTLFFFIPVIIFAQPRENSAQVLTRYSIGKVDSAIYQNTSPGAEIMLGSKWGLNYNIDFIFRNDNIFQMHSSPGLVVIPLFINMYFHMNDPDFADNYPDDNYFMQFQFLWLFASIVDFVLPEGVSYHIPLKPQWDIAPYVNGLCLDYIKNRNTEKSALRYSFNFGTKVTYWSTDNLTMGAFLETRKVYGMGWAAGAGISLGYSFLY